VNLARALRDLLIPALAGAVVGAACVVIAYASHPQLTLEMDRALPRRLASGFYDPERAGETTFAWTSQRADLKLAHLNRSSKWICWVTLRGGRSDPATQPSVDVAVDGSVATTMKATNEFQDAMIVVPARAAKGAVVTVTSSSTLVPGPSDPRQLGVQIDRIVCIPEPGVASPPSATIRDAALTGAIFGALLVLSGLTLRPALAGVLMLGVLQALPLSAGPAPYIGFSETSVWLAIWIGVVAIAIVGLMNRFRPVTLQNSARIAITLSAAVLYLKLLGLLHPSKLPIDAVFHAHRLEWVLAGKYFFTQPMPGGVTFPYAIGLYVFAAPWSVLTHDYVTLLRVIVCGAQAVAGALLYPVVVKAWGDRAAALGAVVLFNVVPLPYGLVGNANLTNTFGEAVATSAVLIASLLSGRHALAVLAFFVASALAFLAHVSTFALLGVTLVTLAVLYRVLGGASERRAAWSIGVVTIVSAVFAVILYYGHFGDVYKNALRIRANATATQSQAEAATTPASVPAQRASLGTRIKDAFGFAAAMIGWPILLLAVVGVWRSVVDRSNDRATLAVMAWAVACAVFFAVAVMRVDAPFQRYAAEFFGRVLLATFPAAVLLAARTTGWAWKQGLRLRLAAASLVVFAVVLGIRNWMAWFL
jgi:hypothetical protein